MTKVLVTGGAGFIGTRLVAALVAHAHEVQVVDNLHSQVHGEPTGHVLGPRDHVLHPMDVRSADSWTALLRVFQPEVIFHLAAETGTGQSLHEASRHASVNVLGTTEMLDALARTGVRPDSLVLTSSRAVYGEGDWTLPDGRNVSPGPRTAAMLEAGTWDPLGPNGERLVPAPNVAGQTPACPTNIYAATKLAQEHLLLAWGSAMGVKIRIRRLQNVFGAGQALGNPYTGVLTYFARLASKREVIPLYEDGAIVRDFVHVGTVVDALLDALTGDVELADVGSGEVTYLCDVADAIARRAGAPPPVITGQYRLGDVRAAGASDITSRRGLASFELHLEELLGWASAAR